MGPQYNRGWRTMSERQFVPSGGHLDVERNDLYRSLTDATRALDMPRACITLLRCLISFYRQTVNGRILVWPSNEKLVEATGYSERAIRLATRRLVADRLLVCVDSANGKRFAIRASGGGIMDAYGFDLSPLLERREELTRLAVEKADMRELVRRQFDQLTIARRQIESILDALGAYYAEIDTEALRARFAVAMRNLPRRTKDRSPGAALAEMNDLKSQAESLYNTASAGKDCRLIENNKNSPYESCPIAHEDKGQGKLEEIARSCPDVMDVAGAVRTDRDLIQEASAMRGVYGTSRDAWEEACQLVGPWMASAWFFVVLQDWCDDQKRDKPTIRNMGGLYRTIVRKAADGQMALDVELARLRRRRQH